MSQASITIPDSRGDVFLTNLNAALAALQSGNSDGSSAPSDPVAGQRWVKPVSGTVYQALEWDGTQWTLLFQINPTTAVLYNADGNRRAWAGIFSGSSNVFTASTTPAITAYEDGQRLVGVMPEANTGACTLNRDSVGAKSVKMEGQDPGSGDLPSGALVELVYYNNLLHVVGGATRNASTSFAGKVRKADETAFLAATADRYPDAAVVKKHARERLQANRTYYIRADGSDSNTGLVNSSGGAWATRQKAWNVIQDTLDLNGFDVAVQIGDGTYTDALAASGWCTGQVDAGSIVFQGNSGTPGNVVINVTSGNCFHADGGAQIGVKDMELRTTTGGNCVQAINNGIILFSNLRFGACAARHIDTRANGVIKAVGSYAITGGAQRHLFAGIGGMIDHTVTITITLSGTPAFSQVFARAAGGLIYCGSGVVTFSGAATGKRYEVVGNGSIHTEGGGANYFPGNSAGTTSPDDEYL